MQTMKYLLDLARRRTNKKVKSLENHLIHFVAANVTDYVQGEVTLSNLPSSVREMVLHELKNCSYEFYSGDKQERVDRMIQAYSQLIIPKIKKIDLGGIIYLGHQENMSQNITKVLEVISHRAGDLEQLDLHANSKHNPFIYSSLEDNSIELILRMENLKFIYFSKVKYIYVKRICKNLKKLQYVKCKQIVNLEGENIEADVEDFKSSFSRLKEFLFRAIPYSFEKRLRKQCILHLPRLEVVHDFADTIEGSLDLDELVIIPEETSGLRHLHTFPTTFYLPAAFPNVTHLKADFTRVEPENRYNSILRFTDIESLALFLRPNASTLNSFLGAYGANLRTLIIESDECENCLNYWFTCIFYACPNLQRLQMHNLQILDDKDPIESFAQLRELHWTPGHDGDHKLDLTNILAAPSLEKFSYEDSKVGGLGAEDLRKLTSLVANRKILHELASLSLDLLVDMDDLDRFYERLRALRNFVAVAAACLPNLVEFKLILIKSLKEHDSKARFYLHSDEEQKITEIGERFHEWIRDDSIAVFIRLINARNQI